MQNEGGKEERRVASEAGGGTTAAGGEDVEPGSGTARGDAGADSGAPHREPSEPGGEKASRSGPVRPRAGVRGRATRLRDPASPCLNCGDPTPGEYCPRCGQRKTEVLVSVRAMVADALEDELILNRRLPRTLFNLFFRPGCLTLEYVNGRIARYSRPLKLYVVSSVLFFLLLSFFSLRVISRADIGDATGAVAGGDTLSLVTVDSMLVELAEVSADTALSGPARLVVDRSRERYERERVRTLAARAAGGDTVADTVAGTVEGRSRGPILSRSERRTLGELLEQEEGEVQIPFSTGAAGLDAAVQRRVQSVMEMTPRQAVERLVGDFLNYIPTMMFVFLPLFALVLKVLYLRRRRYYAEHFIFLLHAHSFVYLLFTVMLLLRALGALPGWLFLTLLLWTLLYLFLAMKRVYGQGWLLTFVKSWVLGWSYAVMLLLSIPAGLLISFLFI